MASNLIEMFNNTVGELLVKQSGSIIGESAVNTGAALNAILPSLLGAVIQKGNSDAGATGLLGYMSENNIDGSILTNANSMLGGGIETEKLMYGGAGILRYLLNDRLSPVVDIIAAQSGLKTSSATSMLKLTAPLLMGILAKHIQEKGLDSPGLKNLLLGQVDFVKAGIPAGIGNVLELSAISSSFAPVTESKPVIPASMAEQSNSISRLLPWIVLGLTSLALFYFVQKGCGKTENMPAEVVEIPKDTMVPEPAPEPVSNMKTYKLPGGNSISAEPGSFTAMLADFLASGEKTAKCVAFDKVSFENGSFKLTSGSEVQLNDLTTLLKAYPDTKVDIVGYTDDAGDDGKNKTLSRERAKVIKSWLGEHGISSGRIDTKGMGEENPVATNKTETGRERNRRVEVCIEKK